MLIYFAVECHNYELRFVWQMSSILQQRGKLPHLLIDCAVLEGDENPLRFPADCLPHHFFDSNLCLMYHPTDRETFARRALTRTEQIARAREAKADWIFFADCDHIYEPRFFCKLRRYLAGTGKDVTNCIHSKWQVHTQVAPTDAACEELREKPIMAHAWHRAMKLPYIPKVNRPVAAGNMQVCKLDAIYEKTGGVYVPANKTKDGHLFNQGQHARSDIQFRGRMGGTTSIDLPAMIHLQHRRDKEEGGHLTCQR